MREFGAGFGQFLKGQRWVAAHGRSYGLGLIPGLISLALYVAALVSLAVWGSDLIGWATPFADDWSSPWQGLFRGFLTAVLFALGLLLSVLTFTALTLVVGQPFYEKLSERVDRSCSPDGTAPESDLPLLRELWISLRDSVRILVRALAWAVLLFACGFIPVIGQTVVPVVGIFVTGFFLTQELTSVALQRRGVELREQLGLLRAHRARVWGFGAPLAICFLVPFVAVFLMPGAVAGATLMVRDLRREDADRDGQDPPVAPGRAYPAAGASAAAPPAPGPYPAAPQAPHVQAPQSHYAGPPPQHPEGNPYSKGPGPR